MKEQIQTPQGHYSYTRHRRQFWLQIFLPLILAVLLIIAAAVLIGIAAFGAGGDSARWAAISTIWLVIPVMLFGLLFLAVLGGLVYLLAKGLQVLPSYTSNAQYFTNRAASQVQRFSDMAAKPVLFLEGIKASMREILERI